VDHAAALIEQTSLLGELSRGTNPSTPVPTCPDWTLRQLLTHVGRGHRWAATIVRERPGAPIDPRTVRDGRQPADPAEALAWLRASAASVLDAVAETGPDTPVWTFTGPRPSAWWVRRRLHEATVHRADAALALGAGYQLSTALAADGVSEWLEIVAARASAAASPLDPGVTLHLHATDADDIDDSAGAGGEWMLRGEPAGVSLSAGHGKATAAVRGRAVDLLLALTRRHTAGDAGLDVLGDPEVWTGWLGRTPY
jgi:uncharacterized protein (TIGR03083 family)